jgi:hypothetical protein
MSQNNQTHDQDEARRAQAHELANQLLPVNAIVSDMDIDFMKQAGNDMLHDSRRMDSAAVLIRNYSPLKSRLLAKQGKAILLLAEYSETLKECSDLKTEIIVEEQQHNNISKMFGL